MSVMTRLAASIAAAPLLLVCSMSFAADAFVESDFKFDNLTSAHKSVIILGVNKLAKENPACASIDPKSVEFDFANASPDDPAFTVSCGEGDKKTKVQFTATSVGAY